LTASQQQQQQNGQQQQQVAVQQRGEDGRAYYTNLCMKAVNQCIGRVIRHRNDWAAVLLVDVRWAAGNVQQPAGEGQQQQPQQQQQQQLSGPLGKLPPWIQQSVQVGASFGDSFSRLARFTKAMAAAA
jgi:chromosome transmission fidelity protein 1